MTTKRYYQKNKEELQVKARQYYKENKKELRAKARQFYGENKEKLNAKSKRYQQENKEKLKLLRQKSSQRLREKVLVHYSGTPPKCACCGEMEIKFLTLDHVNNDGAEQRRKIGIQGGYPLYLWIIKNNFPRGLFQILCYNCNCAKGNYGSCPHEKEAV